MENPLKRNGKKVGGEIHGFSPISPTRVFWNSRKRSAGGRSSEKITEDTVADKTPSKQEESPAEEKMEDDSTMADLSERRKSLFQPLEPIKNMNGRRPSAEMLLPPPDFDSSSYPKGWLIGKKRKLVNVDVVESMRRIAVQEMNRKMGAIERKMDVESEEETTPLSLLEPTCITKVHSLDVEAFPIMPHATSSTSGIAKQIDIRPFRSIYIVMIKAKINVLLPFGPLAILLHHLTGKHGWVFFFSLLGIIPLAERLGYATEQLAFYTGPTVGGLLNATFGNATEMIISIYALKHGMIRVVQQSLLGSILSNMLLVLGFAFFSGGIIHHEKVQVFNKSAALVNSGLLLMAVMGITFPAVLHFTHSEAHLGKSELSLSRFSSCIMLVAYASYLFFQLKSQNNLYSPIDAEKEKDEEPPAEEFAEINFWESISWLSILTLWVSVLSGYLVDAIQGASDSLNLPVSFISVILLPIVGNAAEHASAIMFAMKDKLDITLGVAIGSSTQISMFVIPFCVVVGWFMGQQMDLNFQLFETTTLFITVLVVAFMLQEGTSNYFKGLMLILCYFIVAASFFVHVDPSNSG